MSEKTRMYQQRNGQVQWTTDGKLWEHTNPQVADLGRQRTVSIGHRRNPKTGYYDGGGPFYSVSVKRSFPTTRIAVRGESKATEKYKLVADVGTPLPAANLPASFKEKAKAPESIRPEDLSDLDADGAVAISEVAPTNPNSTCATMLGEIAKDGIPSLPGIRTWRSRTKFLQSLGDEYLNVQFGWNPLVSDVRGVSSSIRDRHTILSQYERDSGRNVRREFEFPIERRSESLTPFEARPSVSPVGFTTFPILGGGIAPMMVNMTLVEENRKWFSG